MCRTAELRNIGFVFGPLGGGFYTFGFWTRGFTIYKE